MCRLVRMTAGLTVGCICIAVVRITDIDLGWTDACSHRPTNRTSRQRFQQDYELADVVGCGRNTRYSWLILECIDVAGGAEYGAGYAEDIEPIPA